MKRFIAFLLLSCLLLTSLLALPFLAKADPITTDPATADPAPETFQLKDVKKPSGASNFDVSEIFSVQDQSGKNTFDLTNQLITEGQEAGSPVAAILLRAINILSLLLGTFAVIMFIISGYMFSTADGDESRLDRAKAMITQTILGTVVGFGAYFIVTLVTSFLF